MTQTVWSEEPTVFTVKHIGISAIQTICFFFSAPFFTAFFHFFFTPRLVLNQFIYIQLSKWWNKYWEKYKKKQQKKTHFRTFLNIHCNHLSSEPFRSFPPTHTLHMAVRKKKKYVKGLLMGFILVNHSHTRVNYRSIQPQTNRDHYF